MSVGQKSKPRAFLTGASGFLGPHVVAALRSQGFDIFCSKAALDDVDKLDGEFAAGPWDIVFHMAGLSLPADCAKSPELAYRTNFNGTLRIMELAAKYKIRGPVIFFSTAYVYSPDLVGAITESSPTEPTTVYGRTKLAAERALADAASLGPPVLVLRLFNHSHKSQRPNFFLPTMFKVLTEAKASAGADVVVPMGDPTLRRDFSSLQDFRATIAKIAAARTKITGYVVCNLCSGQPRELGSLVHAMARRMNLTARLLPLDERMRPGEPRSMYGDPTRLTQLIDSKPTAHSDEEFIDLFLEDLGENLAED